MKKGLLIVVIIVVVTCVTVVSLQLYADHMVRREVEQYSANLPPGFDLHVDKAHYNLFRRSAHIKGVVLRNDMSAHGVLDTIRVEEIAVYIYDTENPTPHYAHIEMIGMNISLPITEQMLLEMEQVGFDREEVTNLKIDATQIYRFDPKTRQLIVHQNDLYFRGLAGFKSKFQLANIDVSVFQPPDPQNMNPFTLLADLGGIQLVSMELYLEIGALTNRIFDGLSQKNSIPVSELREQMAALTGSALSKNPSITGHMVEKIQDFIRTPGDVRITLSPRQPISLMEGLALSKNAALLLEKLNLRIETF